MNIPQPMSQIHKEDELGQMCLIKCNDWYFITVTLSSTKKVNDSMYDEIELALVITKELFKDLSTQSSLHGKHPTAHSQYNGNSHIMLLPVPVLLHTPGHRDRLQREDQLAVHIPWVHLLPLTLRFDDVHLLLCRNQWEDLWKHWSCARRYHRWLRHLTVLYNAA